MAQRRRGGGRRHTTKVGAHDQPPSVFLSPCTVIALIARAHTSNDFAAAKAVLRCLQWGSHTSQKKRQSRRNRKHTHTRWPESPKRVFGEVLAELMDIWADGSFNGDNGICRMVRIVV